MSTQKLGKSAKMSAKRHEVFLKITAGSGIPQLDTKRATAQPIETIGTGSYYSPRPSDAIAKRLIVKNIYLTEDQFKVETKEYLLENEADFYEETDDRNWNTYYEDKLAKPVNFFINSITFALY
ncbi:hypothetical protein F8M41_023529 [Gigaspora margarita]|uniref:Uncharacterized protein n=1 Tax=Gigaspora margarita TaxID=4874 RepID=A0A8H4AD88_GIGMA|nr:hypothetical protein F8M41_023529 [Gigaspora margarita]